MPQIFISGGGDKLVSQQFDKLYYDSLLGKNILYIPRALYPERYESARDRISTIFPQSQGFTTTLLTPEDSRDKTFVHHFDGLYIGGGNTFRLLDLIRSSGFDKVIEQFITADKPIYGGSAGAIVFGKEIHTSSDRNAVQLSLQDTQGFNYFGGYAISCHYKEKMDSEIADYVKIYKIPVIALPEGVGCYLQNKKAFVGGNGYATVFNKDTKEKFHPGQEIMV